jgi:hypothetical protein
VQLLELAARENGARVFVCSVSKALETSGAVTKTLVEIFQEARDNFKSACIQQERGNDDCPLEEPVTESLQIYSAMDIAFLPEFYNHRVKRLGPELQVWLDRISSQNFKWLQDLRSAFLEGQGKEFKFSPSKWRSLSCDR